MWNIPWFALEKKKRRSKGIKRIIINRGIYNGSSSLRVKDNLSSLTFVVIDLDSLDGHLNEQLDPLYFGKQKWISVQVDFTSISLAAPVNGRVIYWNMFTLCSKVSASDKSCGKEQAGNYIHRISPPRSRKDWFYWTANWFIRIPGVGFPV